MAAIALDDLDGEIARTSGDLNTAIANFGKALELEEAYRGAADEPVSPSNRAKTPASARGGLPAQRLQATQGSGYGQD